MIDVNDSPLDCVWVNPLWIDCFEANDVYKWVTQFFGRNSIRQSCGLNILRRNVVRNVDDVCRGIDRKNHSLHCGDKIVLCAEVSKKSDDGIRKGETIFHLSFDICHLPLI